jgi:hypothetical protein
MKYKKFKEFWIGFEEIVQHLQKFEPGIRFKNQDNSRLVWEQYDQINQVVHQDYMSNSENRIDRHKIAALIVNAILNIQPLELNLQPGEKSNYYGWNRNSVFAFKAGNYVLFCFVFEMLKRDRNNVLLDYLISTMRTRGIIYPLCNHGEFEKNTCDDLQYAAIEGSFNILFYSTTLFMIESYHIETCQLELLSTTHQ